MIQTHPHHVLKRLEAAKRRRRQPTMFGLLGGGGAPQSSLLANLSAYYAFETLGLDSTGKVTTLTNDNGVTQVAGLIGKAGNFVAANSQDLQLPGAAAPFNFFGTIDFTFAGWLKMNSAGVAQGVGGHWDNGGGRQWQLNYSGTRYQGLLRDGAGNTAVNANTFGLPLANVWNFLCLRYDSATKVASLSVNAGTADTATLTNSLATSTAQFFLGMSGEVANLDGLMDEWGVWSSTQGAGGKLTNAQVTSLFNGGSGVTYPFTGVP